MIVLLKIIVKYMKDSDSKWAKRVRKFELGLRYESSWRFVVELVLNLSVACWINIWYGGTKKPEDILSFIVSVFTIVALLLLMVYTILYPSFYHKDIISKHLSYFNSLVNPKNHTRHCLLFLDYGDKRLKQMLFFGVFMMRRMFFAFVIVWMKEFTKNQLILILLTFSWVLFYSIRVMPYKHKLNNFLNIFNEWVLVLYSCLLFLFYGTFNPTRLTRAGYAWIGLIATFFIVNWVVIFPIVIYSSWLYLIDKCKIL